MSVESAVLFAAILNMVIAFSYWIKKTNIEAARKFRENNSTFNLQGFHHPELTSSSPVYYLVRIDASKEFEYDLERIVDHSEKLKKHSKVIQELSELLNLLDMLSESELTKSNQDDDKTSVIHREIRKASDRSKTSLHEIYHNVSEIEMRVQTLNKSLDQIIVNRNKKDSALYD